MLDGYYFQSTPVPVPDNEHQVIQTYDGEAVVHTASGRVLGYVWKAPCIREWYWKTCGSRNHGMTASRAMAADMIIRLRGEA